MDSEERQVVYASKRMDWGICSDAVKLPQLPLECVQPGPGTAQGKGPAPPPPHFLYKK